MFRKPTLRPASSKIMNSTLLGPLHRTNPCFRSNGPDGVSYMLLSDCRNSYSFRNFVFLIGVETTDNVQYFVLTFLFLLLLSYEALLACFRSELIRKCGSYRQLEGLLGRVINSGAIHASN